MSFSAFRVAARLASETEDALPTTRGTVRRIVLAVEAEGRQELVTASLVDGKLLLVASDGRLDGPHVQVARAALAGLEVEAAPRVDSASASTSSPGTTSPGRLSMPPPAEQVPPRAQALLDLVTAIVRLGVHDAAGAPAVVEALGRLAKEAGPSPAVGVSRFIGRIKLALAREDVTASARLLDGASRLARDLTEPGASEEARRRVAAFFGGPGAFAADPLIDRTFFEIGRESVAGVERFSIERRYLMDLADGQVYVEAQLRGGVAASLGPSPRLLSAGLSQVGRGVTPPAIQLLQYVVSGALSQERLLSLNGFAVRRFSDLVENYRVALSSAPGLSEPVVLIAPHRFGGEHGVTPMDMEGLPLALASIEAPGVVSALAEPARRGVVSLVSGRLIDHEGTLMLLPLGALVEREGELSWWRLR